MLMAIVMDLAQREQIYVSAEAILVPNQKIRIRKINLL